jgi:ribose-phosphate pyrophosphokinase
MLSLVIRQPNHSAYEVSFTVDHFPCGETNLRVDDPRVSKLKEIKQHEGTFIIGFMYESNDDLINLALLCDALDGVNSSLPRVLSIGYVPYGRQDRRCNEGEPHSLKVISRFINSMGFSSVLVMDPHSDVIEALINNVRIVGVEKICSNFIIYSDYDYLVSPDGGAYKKVNKVAQMTNVPVIRGDKVRDTETGKISNITVHCDEGQLQGKKVLIVDDICDGGGTFNGLALELLNKGAHTVDLYVTHGMFTKGVEQVTHHLGSQIIDRVVVGFYHGPGEDRDLVYVIPHYEVLK